MFGSEIGFSLIYENPKAQEVREKIDDLKKKIRNNMNALSILSIHPKSPPKYSIVQDQIVNLEVELGKLESQLY